MSRISHILFIFVNSVAIGLTARLQNNGIVTLDVSDHFPCVSTESWDEKIRFPSADEKEFIQKDDTREGCYKLGGDVVVNALVSNTLHMHVEMSHGPSLQELNEVADCESYNKETQCDGFGGDCLYCNICDRANQITELGSAAKKGASMWLSYKNKPVNCYDAIKAAYDSRNRKTNVSSGLFMHFCLPSRDQFLEAQGVTKDLWNKLTNGGDNRGEYSQQTSFYMVIRLMETDFRRQLEQQRAIVDRYKAMNPYQEQVPMEIREKLPFNRIIWNNKGFVACHKIFGNIRLE